MLENERDRLAALLERLRAAECYEATAAILRLADDAIADYERMKTARGVLDFEDLVVKTVALLARADASRWVHYKLDRGLDHILVDEAQDTSPRQWQVVKALAEEFFAGEGASGTVRTLFAVGDEKQSIYSFQGAVPSWFSRMRRELGDRARRAGLAWSDPELHLSFRSVPVVLAAVDAIFAAEKAHRGLAAEPGPTLHSAARLNLPGRVILWPMIEPPPKVEPADWASPVDHLGEKSPGGAARQPHRRHHRRLAPPRGAARIDRRADPPRRHPHPHPHPRRADRRHQPRAQDARRADRRRRPPEAHRAHRGHGPDGARPGRCSSPRTTCRSPRSSRAR